MTICDEVCHPRREYINGVTSRGETYIAEPLKMPNGATKLKENESSGQTLSSCVPGILQYEDGYESTSWGLKLLHAQADAFTIIIFVLFPVCNKVLFF